MKVVCFQYIQFWYSQESDLAGCLVVHNNTSDCLQEASASSTEGQAAPTCFFGTGGAAFYS